MKKWQVIKREYAEEVWGAPWALLLVFLAAEDLPFDYFMGFSLQKVVDVANDLHKTTIPYYEGRKALKTLLYPLKALWSFLSALTYGFLAMFAVVSQLCLFCATLLTFAVLAIGHTFACLITGDNVTRRLWRVFAFFEETLSLLLQSMASIIVHAFSLFIRAMTELLLSPFIILVQFPLRLLHTAYLQLNFI